MSGDVQPRKRRDKKKKKEDGPEEVSQHLHQHQPAAPPNVIDESNIHIQKEPSTGGGFCAKFVFFILLTVLATLIGLIITEHRGLTDLDTVNTDSRFAQLFDGWIDKSIPDHGSPEEHSMEESEEHLYEEEDEEEEDEVEESDDEHEEEQEDNQSLSNDENEEKDEKSTDEVGTDEEYDEDRDEGSENVSRDDDDENEEEIDENEEEQEESEIDEEYHSEEEDKYEASDAEQDQDSAATKEEDEENEKSEEKYVYKSNKIEKRIKSKLVADKTESEESVDQNESDIDKSEAVTETTPIKKAIDDDGDDDTDGDSEGILKEVSSTHTDKKIDDGFKKSTKKVSQEKQVVSENKETEEVPKNVEESDTYNMVVKFGVGTALLVVAHVVLIQKWRTENVNIKKDETKKGEAECETPDLSRRNTIVTPPSFQEIEHDIENLEEEHLDYEEDDNSDDNSRLKPERAKLRYQELQSTYSQSLSPDWQPKGSREKSPEEQEEEEEEENEEDEEYDDEISENEDEDLLQRLEAKYGKIRQSDEEVGDDEDADDDSDEEDDGDLEDQNDYGSWKRVKVSPENVPEDSDSETEKNWLKQKSGAQAVYDFSNITNSDDWNIRAELDVADQNIANDAAYALTLFNKILEKNPSSPRALYGKAQSLHMLAELKKSNNLLQQSIVNYQQVLKSKNVPSILFQSAAEKCIDRMRFRGLYSQAVGIHEMLIDKYPDNIDFRNSLAVTYLTMNKVPEARKVIQKTLAKWPANGFALVHYGFILKTSDNNLEEAVKFLRKGIETKAPGVVDGRFYFHLGDALARLGRKDEAMAVYSDGVANGVFLSKYQRSLYNVKRLAAKPWWNKEDIPHKQFFKTLEDNWKIIRDEGLNVLNREGYFQPESENLRDVGDWKQFELYARGARNHKNCRQCPVTCKVVESLPDASGCRRGQIKFSVMHPGTHVWPHCGPTNCRLRIHLGLKVPPKTYIRVGEDIRSWKEGKLFIFDDSFEHEVWHNGSSIRLVLIIDIWHPELTKVEKQTLSSI